MIPLWYHLSMIRSINKETDVAILVLQYIAKKKELVTVTELTKKLKVQRPFLRKVLQILAKNGVLKSIKGKNGGFILEKNPEEISIFDIVKIFQNGFEFLNCVDENGKECILIKTCKLRQKLLKLEEMMKDEFVNTSIFELI